MLDQRFYWGTIRKTVIAFGNMFNGITIQRNDAQGSPSQTIKVPLSYAPKQKFLAKIQQRPDVDVQNIQVLLPRMSFEMVDIFHDPQRKISPVQQTRNVTNNSLYLNTQYAPSPYNITMLLYIYTKNMDDGLQIVEQILPYFNPDFNLSLKTIPELGIKNDLPIILDNIGFEDDYEGDLTTRRAIIWTLSFTMKLNFYGPASKQGIIRTSIANTFSDPTLNNRQQKITVGVDPDTATPVEPFEFFENFEDF
jgi:hypothetical protein